ncbi:MAG: NUDIX domain-containing protein [Oscillospiraceae bacterium]|nr:NUDIX domain-containing protein [Oscillospiraceae bacterium]
MSELWDAYDSKFNKIENVTLVRGEAVPENMYHLVSEIIVKHTDGTYLLMQRDHAKHFGGMWELTAGGSALKGETAEECAIRELREETGIEAADLREISRIVHDVHRTLYVEYLCVTDWDKDAVTLQEGETVAYKWAEKQDILEMDETTLASSRSAALLKNAKL